MIRIGRTRPQHIVRLLVVSAAAVLVVVIAAIAILLVLVRLGTFASTPLGGDLADARSDRPGMRVLFIGNSLTFENDMPGLLRRLVASDPSNRPLFAVRYSPGGYTLGKHSKNNTVRGLLDTVRWDDVVLQENSNVASLDPVWRPPYMDAPARDLVERIRGTGAQPMFFVTPGYRTGSGVGVFDTYGAMQDRLDLNYRAVAGELAAPLAPVGPAWAEALGRRPGIALWQPDGVHPSVEGAYLNACVFYAVLYHRTPSSSFTAGLARSDATFLQRVAGSVVS
jgi:hypothetical protein